MSYESSKGLRLLDLAYRSLGTGRRMSAEALSRLVTAAKMARQSSWISEVERVSSPDELLSEL